MLILGCPQTAEEVCLGATHEAAEDTFDSDGCALSKGVVTIVFECIKGRIEVAARK